MVDHDPVLLAEMKAMGQLTDEDIATLMGEDFPAVVEAKPIVEDSDVEIITRHIEASVTRDEIYAEQQSVGQVSSIAVSDEDASDEEPEPVSVEAYDDEAPVAAEEAPAAIKKVRKAVKKGEGPGRRVARMSGSTSMGAYAASVAGESIDLKFDGSLPVDTASLVDGINAVKIREKAVNFLDFFHAGKGLSVFTQAAMKKLTEDGKITAKGLIDSFRAKYTDGTARSQAQQMTTILKVFGIVNVVGGDLVADPDSNYLRRFAG